MSSQKSSHRRSTADLLIVSLFTKAVYNIKQQNLTIRDIRSYLQSKMSDEVFDDEFYQEDFTSGSEYESFVSRLSELLEKFEVFDEETLSKNQLSLCEWIENKDEILFNDFDLIVTRYNAKIPQRVEPSKPSQFQVFQDLISTENDYCLLDTSYLKNDYEVLNAPKPPKIHPIAVWYGLRDFIVIRNKRKHLNNTSQIKLLQSSLSLAVSDSKSKIPAFIQVLYHEQDVYLGVLEHGQQRLSFDIVHLKVAPPSCKYLSGLLDMFKGKINVNYVNPTMVSVCLSYSLKNFLTATYSSDKKNDDYDLDVIDFINIVSNLPFGVSIDPVHEMILYTRWPQVSENVVFDSHAYSDFNPLNSPQWSIRIRYDYSIICYLADILHEYLTLSESPEALSEYYNFLSPKNRSKDIGNPFAVLTDSTFPSLPGISMLETGSYMIKGPLNEQQMKKIFHFLMPDEDPENKFPYAELRDDQVKVPVIWIRRHFKYPSTIFYFQFDPFQIKSAIPDTLVHRLSILLANIYSSFSGRRGVAQFWAEFSQKLRQRVENCSRIPG